MSRPSYRVEEYASEETTMKQVASNQQAKLACPSFMVISCSACFLTLKMEATCYSEMSAFKRQHNAIFQKIELLILKCGSIFLTSSHGW
jgi:hypothetical protein